MGFNKKIVGELQIDSICKNLNEIRYFLKSDCLLFTTNEVEQKFRTYEKKYISDRNSVS
jgi:hypothetical protein